MDPVKRFRIVYWASIGVLVLAIVAGGYYFFQLDSWKESVVASKDEKIATLEANLQSKTNELESATASAGESQQSLATEKSQLESENSALKAKASKALAYNEVFKYMTGVIKTHNGFTGWTDAEFQVGKTKAEATGSTAFVSTINWAWYETSVTPNERVIRVWEEMASGIENALK